jgi:uncharacterized integral membrane protein
VITLITLVLFGIVVSYLSIQNTARVTLQVAGFAVEGMPLYLVILGSLLLGFLIAGVLSSINSLFSAFKIMGKNNTINNSQKEIENLKEQVHQLELANAELKSSRT